jgi:hypothetical protein
VSVIEFDRLLNVLKPVGNARLNGPHSVFEKSGDAIKIAPLFIYKNRACARNTSVTSFRLSKVNERLPSLCLGSLYLQRLKTILSLWQSKPKLGIELRAMVIPGKPVDGVPMQVWQAHQLGKTGRNLFHFVDDTSLCR